MKEKLNKIHQIFIKYHCYYYFVMVLLLAFDLISKYSIESLLLKDADNRISVIKGFFDLHLIYNTGAFSGFLGNSIFGRIVLVLLSLICGVAMIFAFVKYFSKYTKFEKFGLTLAIAGTFGNFVDRFLMVLGLQEGVIDFLEFDLGFMVWNTFNIADAILVVGIIAFAVGYLIRESKNSKKEEKEREQFYQDKKDEPIDNPTNSGDDDE